jgi:hypothetical protein
METTMEQKLLEYHRNYSREWRQRTKTPEKLKHLAEQQRVYRKNNNKKLKKIEQLSRLKTRQTTIPNRLLALAKLRAKKKGLPFNLSLEYIVSIWPKDNNCPVFNTPFQIDSKGSRSMNATLDRIIPSEGYIKGNVVVISFKANRIKNDATTEELYKVADFFKLLTSRGLPI